MVGDGRGFWDAAVAMTPAAQALHSTDSVIRPYDADPLDITLFVACENNAALIVATLQTLAEAMENLDLRFEIIVTDDASTDDSAARVREYIAQTPEQRIVLRVNPERKGLAQNYVDAAFIGKGKYFCLIYGDSTETMETRVDIFKALGEADILIPYHIESLHMGADSQRFPKLYARVLNYFSDYPLKDYSQPAVHLRYNIMRWHGNGHGFGFQVELLCRLLDMGFTYKQMPSRSIARRSKAQARASVFYPMLSIGNTVFDIVLRRIAGSLKQ